MRGFILTTVIALSIFLVGASPATNPAALRVKDDAPDVVKKWWADQPKLRAEKKKLLMESIKKLQADLKEFRSSRFGSGQRFATRERRDDAIKKTNENIVDHQKSLREVNTAIVYPDTLPGSDVITTIKNVWIDQIVDSNNAIASISKSENTIVNHDHVEKYEEKSSFWLTGFPTEGHADHDVMHFDDVRPVWSKSSKTYATAIGGQKTLTVVEPFDPMQFLIGK